MAKNHEGDDYDPAYEADKIARRASEPQTEKERNDKQREKLAAEKAASEARRNQGESCPKKGGAIALLAVAILAVPGSESPGEIVANNQEPYVQQQIDLGRLALEADIFEQGTVLTNMPDNYPHEGAR